MGILSLGDLVHYFPFRYEYKQIVPVNETVHNEKITVIGTIATSVTVNFFQKNKSRLSFQMLIENEKLITVVIFNQKYLKPKLRYGQKLLVSGKWDHLRRQLTLSTLKFVNDASKVALIEPVYKTLGNISMDTLKKWIVKAMCEYEGEFTEFLPDELRQKYRLLSKKQSLVWIHCPSNAEELRQAKRRLIYEELLIFQLRVQLLRHKVKKKQARFMQEINRSKVADYIKSLPFALTADQKAALGEILDDLDSPGCMNRMLQGGVGSGKTVVSLIAALAVVNCGYQVAIMVPTEILAEQHLQTFQKLLGAENINVDLLTARLKGKKRKKCLDDLQVGNIDIIIGTHALIQQDVIFHKLGFVVIDEQHRFGVRQRKILYEKGMYTNVLFMTATPIPRTLALTVFGEMDVSVMKGLPQGRKEIITKVVTSEQVIDVLSFLSSQINKGQQAYVVCPLIEESESQDMQNVVAVYEQLTKFFCEKANVAFLHGRLGTTEKEEIMTQFSAGNYQILVATTVVEVGIDVPNATCIVIYNAERFGLAQLHQLRGRVGRSALQSYCILIGNPKNEIAAARLQIMTETNDGFYISERDLQLRGHGDVLGYKQSGLPDFKLADLKEDLHIMEIARADARSLVENEQFWQSESYDELRTLVT